ncbi:MAG: hypothetical protein JRI23_19120, partial [Deltaproteobacteria bacterium]|nr:hypothetical protein [Deltaproteobacteria bacterium]MBW2533977.1 hypothetical protein [Deltaproteobacteria bacterium]
DAADRAPLPLLLFFHPEHDSPRAVGRSTKLRRHNEKADLTGDPARRGFLTLAVQGRRIHGRTRFATVPATRDNVDAQTVDHFVAGLQQERLVDGARVYTVGYGEGAPMAMLYAMLRPDLVASVALFAGVPAGLEWGCEGSAPPTLLLYRACDALTPCEEAEQWLDRWQAAGHTAVGVRLGAGPAEETHCSSAKKCRSAKGEANHRRWPKGRELELLDFLARHRLELE